MAEQRTIQRVCPECQQSFGEEYDHCPDDGARLRKLSIRTGTEDDELVGQDIEDRFHLESVLGAGGMGKVYRGTQLSVGREVAVKVLRSELASDETLVKRFFREAQVISKLSHPNIVRLVDFGQDVERDVLYLAMEYIDGIELSDLVAEHRLDPALAVDTLIQACEALSEPHASGIIHRDLKPENVMLLPRTDGRVQTKLVDFGIAHTLQEKTKLTQTGLVFGTAHYMAPEQAEGKAVQPSTDIYSLGCILFQLLTGRTPFEDDTSVQLLLAHVNRPPPLVSDFVSGRPAFEELSRLVRSMMSKEAGDRPTEVLDVRDELEQIQRRHSFGPIRVDAGKPVDEMFRKWLLEPPGSDVEEVPTAGGAPDREQGGDDFGLEPTREVESGPHLAGDSPAVEIADDSELSERPDPDSDDFGEEPTVVLASDSEPTIEVDEAAVRARQREQVADDEHRPSGSESDDKPKSVPAIQPPLSQRSEKGRRADSDGLDQRAVIGVAVALLVVFGLVVVFVTSEGDTDADESAQADSVALQQGEDIDGEPREGDEAQMVGDIDPDAQERADEADDDEANDDEEFDVDEESDVDGDDPDMGDDEEEAAEEESEPVRQPPPSPRPSPPPTPAGDGDDEDDEGNGLQIFEME